jgi:regulator of PEP synthase PpsR (kinase-PPPase family)
MGKRRQHLILAISDGTGATVEHVAQAALVQFPGVQPQIERRPEIRTREQVSDVIREARDRAAMVVHTLVSPELRRHLYMEATSYDVIAVDLLGTILTEMARYLGTTPAVRPGLLYGDESYTRRIEAIEFTIRHDDGQGASDLDQADIVITGISRTSKTPVSIFLAYRGYRVANVPIVLNMPLPATVEQVPPGRIVGLVVNPSSLAVIRKTRLHRYHNLSFDYADLEHIRQELRYSRELFATRRWPVIDVSGKAVEETAREVLNLVCLEAYSATKKDYLEEGFD